MRNIFGIFEAIKFEAIKVAPIDPVHRASRMLLK
jgi:hypothetical protein